MPRYYHKHDSTNALHQISISAKHFWHFLIFFDALDLLLVLYNLSIERTMKKRRIILLLTCIVPVLLSVAQNKVSFAYDETGNRIKREFSLSRQGKAASRSTDGAAYYDALGDCTVKISHDSSGLISISILDIGKDDKASIEVYTLSGMPVFTQDIPDALTIVDISNQPCGIYIS